VTLNQTTKPVEMDVCDWLNANECIKGVVADIIKEYCRACDAHVNFPFDVVRAAAIVSEEAGELVKAANNIDEYDCPEYRQNLDDEAVQVGAMAIRFLENIGNLKARE
jgi:NTP pyrophosphatase (non-canonical NTP hydrolase)